MGNYTARSRDNATGNQNTFTQSNVALPRMQSDLNTQGKIRQNNFRLRNSMASSTDLPLKELN